VSAPPVTRGLVRWAYRLVLGREPESEETLEAWTRIGDFAALREGMLGSPEFVQHAQDGFAARGGWIHGPVTEEAAAALLALRDGAAAAPEAVAAARTTIPDLPALRRLLLDAPEVERRLPRRTGPVTRTLHAGGQAFAVHAPAAHPEIQGFPGHAPRHARVLRAALPDAGAGAVIVDAGAGIGLGLLGLAAGAPGRAMLHAHEERLAEAALLVTQIGANALPRVRAHAVPFAGPFAGPEALAGPLAVLRLGTPGAVAALPGWAPALRAMGTLVIARLDLAAVLGAPGGDARGLLHGWRALFAHLTAFTPAGEPYAVADEAGVTRALLGALARADRADEFVLSADDGWRARLAP
jgi:hypothetical protein